MNRNPIQTRKKKIHWNNIGHSLMTMIMSSPHLTPGHAKVCGGKVSAEEAITEAPGDVGVSADQ